MNTDYTHISILLDRSGSMDSIKDDVIGGFNSFIEEQKKVPGKLTVTLSQFDTDYDVLFNSVDISKIPDIKGIFQPRGMTALLDSAAKLIIDTGKSLAEMNDTDRPGKILFVMITDGHENASEEQTRDSLAKMIKHQEEKYK